MNSTPSTQRSDFFLSRRGSVATIAREVADILTEKGYSVVVQDYDIPINADFVSAMHEGIKNARDLIVLFTGDYEASPYTRREFTAFEADRAQTSEERRVVILRCEDVALRGLFAPTVYQDLVGVDDPDERRARILAAVDGRSQGLKPPPRPFIGVPPRVASFTGRGEELDRLDSILIGGRAAAVTQASRMPVGDTGRVAVQGMGGVGKTSLAAEYAYRYRDLYAGVWWCPAETRTGLATALAALAVELGAAAPNEGDIDRAARAALRRLGEQRALYLLVYDNVTTPDDIADLLPSSGARVLITSRFSDWAGWAEEVALDVMPLAEAVTCLEVRARRNDPDGAAALAQALGCLPLALDHAAATCRRTQMRFADYAARAASMIAAAPRGAAYPRSVAATFDLAIATATGECPSAGPLMAFLSACAPERIPMTLLEGAIADPAERGAALLALTDVSLVRNDPFPDGTPAVIVHRLVQAVARSRAGKDFDAAATKALDHLAHIFPEGSYGDHALWPTAEKLAPHALIRFEDRKASPSASRTAAAYLCNSLASYVHGRAFHTRERSLMALARRLFEEGLALREAEFGPDHFQTAMSVNNLAVLLADQLDFAAAIPLNSRALTIFEKELGPEHPDTSAVLSNLGHLLKRVGRMAEAEDVHRRAFEISARTRGRHHLDTVTLLQNYAAVIRDLGRLEEAEPMLREAVEVSQEKRGRDHPITVRFEANLGKLYLATGRPALALEIAERSLAVSEAQLGADHPWTKDSAQLHASALAAMGRDEDATEIRRRYGLEAVG